MRYTIGSVDELGNVTNLSFGGPGNRSGSRRTVEPDARARPTNPRFAAAQSPRKAGMAKALTGRLSRSRARASCPRSSSQKSRLNRPDIGAGRFGYAAWIVSFGLRWVSGQVTPAAMLKRVTSDQSAIVPRISAMASARISRTRGSTSW